MFDLSSNKIVISLMDKLAKSEVIRLESNIVDFIMEKQQDFFKPLDEPKFRAGFIARYWILSRLDKSGRLRNVGIGLNILPTFLGQDFERQLCQGLKLKGNNMSLGIVKVIIFCSIFSHLPKRTFGKLDITLDKGNLILQSPVPNSQMVESTEVFNLSPLQIFKQELDRAIAKSKLLNQYSLSKKPCSQYENPDNILDIIDIAKSEKLNRIRINKVENFESDNYVISLFTEDFDNYFCILSFSDYFTKHLLGQNPFRVFPESQNEALNYRSHLKSYFSDNLDQSCTKPGMLYYKNKYRVNFPVHQPGIERCAAICAFQSNSYRLQKDMKYANLKINSSRPCIPVGMNKDFGCVPYLNSNFPCKSWSFDTFDSKCYLSIDMSDNDFSTNLYAHYNYKGAITGKFDCLPKVARKEIFVQIGNELVDARKVCHFSPENLNQLPLLTKCESEFHSVNRPLKALYEQTIYFQESYVNLYHFKSSQRKKRSAKSLIFQILRNAANHHGKSILKSLVKGLGQSVKSILKRTTFKLKNAGFNSLMIDEPQLSNVKVFDYSQISIYFDRLNDLTGTHKINNMKLLINQLESEFLRLKNYFSVLMTDNRPILNTTMELVKNNRYIFTPYLLDGNIIRHFLIGQKIPGSIAKFVSILPTNSLKFNNLANYQFGLFAADQKSDSCLVSILNQRDIDQLIEKQVCQQKENTLVFNENLILLNHTFKTEIITIFSAKAEAFIEIYCPLESFLWVSKILIIVAVPKACTVIINKQTIQVGVQQFSEFVPQILFKEKYNETMNGSNSYSNFFEQDWIIYGFGLLLGAIGMIIGAICLVKKQGSHFNTSYFKVQQPQPENMNLENREITNEVFEKPIESLTKFTKL